jgi:hypothetical protein
MVAAQATAADHEMAISAATRGRRRHGPHELRLDVPRVTGDTRRGTAHCGREDDLGPAREKERPGAGELHPDPSLGGFHWGYNGGGPGRAAAAILADALLLSDGSPWERCDLDRDVLRIQTALRIDLLWDVTCLLTPEWRMRRSAVLRWVRGWYADKGLADPPAATVGLPPADPYEADREGSADREQPGLMAGTKPRSARAGTTATATPVTVTRLGATSLPSSTATA